MFTFASTFIISGMECRGWGKNIFIATTLFLQPHTKDLPPEMNYYTLRLLSRCATTHSNTAMQVTVANLKQSFVGLSPDSKYTSM